ncbi:hypothetical protein BVY01_03630 [bacterium I07]|nr:hypothetical protein BVY01_03630 [bacterium I07]
MKNTIIIASCFLFVLATGIRAQQDIHWNPDIEYGSFMDSRNGQVYNTVKIGNKTWMAQNFNLDVRKYSVIYEKDPTNATVYGRLYSWDSAREMAPAGWHLPTKEEWQELTEYLGGKKVAGGKMKEIGTVHWKEPNKGASNSSGFTALPGGILQGRSFGDSFLHRNSEGYFWTASKYDNYYSWYVSLSSREPEIYQNYCYHNSCLSVRYVKDD